MRSPGLLAALALALALGCADETRAPCAPGQPGCVGAGIDPAADPRFVGPGMRSGLLPHWPMFHHDAQHTGLSPIAPPSAGLLKWSFQTEGEIWSSPAIGLDGTIYVGSLDRNL
jgi:hypothetical protein